MDLKHSEDFYVRSLLKSVKLGEVMTKNVVSILVSEPFSRVYDKLVRHHIRHLPVVDDGNHVVGLVTQRDLYRLQSPRHLENGEWYYDRETLDAFILAHVMTPHPLSMTPEQTVAESLLAMVDFKYGCIPIVTGNEKVLCGIITQLDILKIGAQILREGA